VIVPRPEQASITTEPRQHSCLGEKYKTQLVCTWRPLAPSTKQHECQTDVLLRALNANVLRVNASSLAMATGNAILLPAPYVRVDSVFI